MKVKVKIDTHQCTIKGGEICELVGFCVGGDTRPYAVLCSDKHGTFDFVPIYAFVKHEAQPQIEKTEGEK